MRDHRILLRGVLLAALLFFLLPAKSSAAEIAPEDFECEYIQKLYTSEEGLDGTSVNCVFSDNTGMIWIGSYSGLFSYDSVEFHRYEIEDHTVAVRCITQGPDGTLWIGTNGDGIYSYDGENFTPLPIESDEGVMQTIYDIEVDENGVLRAASGGGMLIAENSEKAVMVDSVGFASGVRELKMLRDGAVISVGRNGIVMKYKTGGREDITPREMPAGEKIRCAAALDDGRIFLGTDGKTILEIDASGKVLQTISTGDISSINEIREINENAAWICADNGIAILQGEKVTPVHLKMNSSVEMVCEDYQGNYWFASSRTGLLHLYKNRFEDLGNYLGISETVNCVEVYHGELYVGTDEGLFCYRGRTPVVTPLVRRCRGFRVRQLLTDDEDQLWAATARHGLLRLSGDGDVTSFNTDNSSLGTNDLRCLYRNSDGVMYIGTDYGIFSMDQNDEVHSLPEGGSSAVNSERILCIAEDSEGTVLAGTDGDGIYLIKDGEAVKHITREDGLVSNVILKLRIDEDGSGCWVVSGSGIAHLSKNNEVRNVTGIPMTNSLDLIRCGDGEVVILARNGFFLLKEAELLEPDPEYEYYSRESGFVVDATSNADHCISGRKIYICGTDGLASFDPDREKLNREIRACVFAVEADGKRIEEKDGSYLLGENTYRLNLDIRPLNYCKDPCRISYDLDGMDHKETEISADVVGPVSYTNLKGRTYRYRFSITDDTTGRVMDEKTITIRKDKKFWEESSSRISLLILMLVLLGGVLILFLQRREKRIENNIRRKYMERRRKEIERAMYIDPVTGAYNRSYFELCRTQEPFENIKALVMVGLNNAEYLKKENGLIYYEDLLRKTYRILRDSLEEDVQIYRISEYVFCIHLQKNVVLEELTWNVKHSFEEYMNKIGGESPGLSVGAVYNDPYMGDDYRSLFDRCDNMRSLDQKHGESQYIRKKIAEAEAVIRERNS